MTPMINRQAQLEQWLARCLNTSHFKLTALCGDASFRSYYRLQYDDNKRIIMNAPPAKENLHQFITIAEILNKHQIRAPQIYAVDEQLGFAILEDFGDRLLLGELNNHSADVLYKQAITTLLAIQQCPTEQLPSFNQRFMKQEMGLFSQWFLDAYLKLELSTSEKTMIEDTFSWLSAEIDMQPTVFIHRDYHSRNIMICNDNTDERPGIIDFQDAMAGPLTYDLVSLLKDCYIQWPREQIISWLTFFYQQSELAKQLSLADFIRAFDLCGLQRHIKVLGIFTRLYLRDNKSSYLKDLPLTLNYVVACLETYSELLPFYQLVQQRIQLP